MVIGNNNAIVQPAKAIHWKQLDIHFGGKYSSYDDHNRLWPHSKYQYAVFELIRDTFAIV